VILLSFFSALLSLLPTFVNLVSQILVFNHTR
jgi:hypothetical protein